MHVSIHIRCVCVNIHTYVHLPLPRNTDTHSPTYRVTGSHTRWACEGLRGMTPGRHPKGTPIDQADNSPSDIFTTPKRTMHLGTIAFSVRCSRQTLQRTAVFGRRRSAWSAVLAGTAFRNAHVNQICISMICSTSSGNDKAVILMLSRRSATISL